MLFGVSKQAYYKYDDNAALSKSASEEFALQYIRGVKSGCFLHRFPRVL